MGYDKALIAGKLRRWEKYLERFRLPAWDDIPDFGLYMEQTVQLLKQYLDYMPPELKEEQIITAATINNYVRTRVMPEPKKKKYYRQHIAYLIMICTLKQSLSIAMVQKLIPMGLSDEELRELYERYSQRHQVTAGYFVDQVRMASHAGSRGSHGACRAEYGRAYRGVRDNKRIRAAAGREADFARRARPHKRRQYRN